MAILYKYIVYIFMYIFLHKIKKCEAHVYTNNIFNNMTYSIQFQEGFFFIVHISELYFIYYSHIKYTLLPRFLSTK